MVRIKSPKHSKKRKKKYFRIAKGYYAKKKSSFRQVKQQVERSLRFSYIHRRKKKREFRRLWILRINAACRKAGLNYSKFIYGLKKANIKINRKILSNIAITDFNSFLQLVNIAKQNISQQLPSTI